MKINIEFMEVDLPQKIYEIDKDLINKITKQNKEILEKNTDLSSENNDKTYRRKIKKKTIE